MELHQPADQPLGAAAPNLAAARAQLAMLRGDRADAEHQYRLLLASGKADDWKTFAATLLTVRDTALAGRVLEDLATPERLPANESIWVALSQLGEHLGRHVFARKLADAAVQRFDAPDAIRWAASLRVTTRDRAGGVALYARDEEQGLGDMPYPPDYPKMPGEPPRVQPSRKNAANWEAG